MNPPTAELASVSSSMDELVNRLSDLAEGFATVGRVDITQEIYEVERTLAGGVRRLERLVARSR